MKTFMITLAAVCLSAVMAVGQPQPSVQAPMNAIYVGADGKFEAAPDTAVIQFQISPQADTARGAYDKASAAAEKVRQVLKSNGLDPKAAEIGFFAVQPQYDWKNPKHKVIGYRVVTSVTLKLHDFSKVGPITEQTADIEDTQNQSLSYTLENVDAAKEKATADAIRRAHNEASAAATAGGRSLGELLYASVDVNQQVIVPMVARPLAMRAGVAEAAPPPPMEGFTPQSVTINAHVIAMFSLK